MKVISAAAMADLEAQAYNQGCKEHNFMENAGKGIAVATQSYIEQHALEKNVWLLCGKGNNGGDAFVAGCELLDQGFQVIAIQPENLDCASPLCQQNGRRFLQKQGKLLRQLESFGNKGVILDGLFGTGFKGTVRAPYDTLIDQANQSKLPILAIDIPSGLSGTTGKIEGKVIQAHMTFYLGLPKTGFFLENGWNVVGKLHEIDFGLPKQCVDQANGDFELITHKDVAALLPSIIRNRHKYQAGYVIGWAGSPSMPGAALLSSLAAFRGGSGIVKLLHPQGMEAELAASPYELIKIPYEGGETNEMLAFLKKGGAIFVGPGLGRSEKTTYLLQDILPALDKPCVIDADALILYANSSFQLPPQSILTPHTGEMQALLGDDQRLNLDLELLKRCQTFANDRSITLVLKGAPTFIFQPGHPIYVNPTGDPGMATAGSGDVLTGLLASLLAQGLNCHAAALAGVYIHGLAGEYAASDRQTSRGVMASDIIAHFDEAFRSLEF